MTKEEKVNAFDPNGLASNSNLFGLPFNYAESEVVVLPVPWEVTVSYSAGTANAPEAIKKASLQVDLYDSFLVDAWKRGIIMLEVDKVLSSKSLENRKLSETYLEQLETGNCDEKLLKKINSI